MGVKKTCLVKFIRKGDTGDKGEQGAVLRGPQAWADCAVGYAFKQGAPGEAWLDVVLYNDYYYYCKKSHVKTSSNYPGSTTAENQGLWQLGDSIGLVATRILLAQYALVKNLGVEAIDMRDSNGNVVFQAKDGNVICKTGTFENVNITGKLTGSVRNPFVSAGDSFDTDYGDNVAMLSEGDGWLWAYSLPWDVRQSGRRIFLMNSFWKGQTAYGQASISAPTGKYFYENGVQKTELNFSCEFVELMGYGTTTQFYGWVVVSRNYVNSQYKYGRDFRVLAHGRVTGTSSSVSISYSSFDGSKLSVSRLSTGHYRLNLPSGWFNSADHVLAMLTGVGNCYGGSSPVKATLITRTTSYIEVAVSDDASENDGSFDFILSNGNDW